ncbi:hypothetical protein CL654_00255, partial [bacterium]|nr:hypothetical protein [bacterium]
MADTNDKGNGKEYESKLEEARRELSGSFSSPRAKTADESAVHAIQKDEVLSNLSDDELAEKKREAQMALGGAPRQKKRVYSKLEREALARAQDVSRIMKAREEEHERSRTAPPPTNLPGTHVAPPKVTPDQVHFKKQVTKPSYATRFVASVKDSDIDALLNETKGEKNKDVEQAPVVKPAQTNPLPQLKKQTDHEKLSEEITKEKQSLVQLAIEEQKRRAALSQSGYYEKAQRRQTVIIIAAIVFALLGTGLIIYNVFLTR